MSHFVWPLSSAHYIRRDWPHVYSVMNARIHTDFACRQFVQKKISECFDELETWSKVALTENPRYQGRGENLNVNRQQLLLRLDYWSTKMLVTRPCLCRTDQRIRDESKPSADFNATSGEACVEAALEMTKLFPDEPDLGFIYSQGPWWAVTHFSKCSSYDEYVILAYSQHQVIQAIAVLLLEMTYQDRKLTSSDSNIIATIKKMIGWLRAMQANDPVAAQANRVVRDTLKKFAPAMQAQANDLLAMDEDSTMSPYQTHQGRPPVSSYQHQPWADTRHAADSSEMSGFPGSQHQAQDDVQGQLNDPYPFSLLDYEMLPPPFGNPFFNNFDQNVPRFNPQDLWSSAGPSTAFDPNWPNTDDAEDYAGETFDEDMNETPQ
jgi:hypothetical protein